MVSTLSDTPSYMGITNFPDAFRNITKFKIGTISPGPVLVFVIIAVIMGIVLHKTKYGRKIFLVGVNQNAGEFSGINTKKSNSFYLCIECCWCSNRRYCTYILL